jgi:hypothetical protein
MISADGQAPELARKPSDEVVTPRDGERSHESHL